jgi:general stress protein 26
MAATRWKVHPIAWATFLHFDAVQTQTAKASPDVCLAFADIGSNTFFSLTGHVEMMRDNVKANELWNNEPQAWWPKGPTDPDVRVLRVLPDTAEYWDSHGSSVTVALKLLAARLSGNPPI